MKKLFLLSIYVAFYFQENNDLRSSILDYEFLDMILDDLSEVPIETSIFLKNILWVEQHKSYFRIELRNGLRNITIVDIS